MTVFTGTALRSTSSTHMTAFPRFLSCWPPCLLNMFSLFPPPSPSSFSLLSPPHAANRVTAHAQVRHVTPARHHKRNPVVFCELHDPGPFRYPLIETLLASQPLSPTHSHWHCVSVVRYCRWCVRRVRSIGNASRPFSPPSSRLPRPFFPLSPLFPLAIMFKPFRNCCQCSLCSRYGGFAFAWAKRKLRPRCHVTRVLICAA
jgi:hypothetical protein